MAHSIALNLQLQPYKSYANKPFTLCVRNACGQWTLIWCVLNNKVAFYNDPVKLLANYFKRISFSLLIIIKNSILIIIIICGCDKQDQVTCTKMWRMSTLNQFSHCAIVSRLDYGLHFQTEVLYLRHDRNWTGQKKQMWKKQQHVRLSQTLVYYCSAVLNISLSD